MTIDEQLIIWLKDGHAAGELFDALRRASQDVVIEADRSKGFPLYAQWLSHPREDAELIAWLRDRGGTHLIPAALAAADQAIDAHTADWLVSVLLVYKAARLTYQNVGPAGGPIQLPEIV